MLLYVNYLSVTYIAIIKALLGAPFLLVYKNIMIFIFIYGIISRKRLF